jgi:hypothetical protein
LAGSYPDGKVIGAEVNTYVLVAKFRMFGVVIGGVIYIHASLTSTLGGERRESKFCRFTPEERTPVSHLIEAWIDLKAN